MKRTMDHGEIYPLTSLRFVAAFYVFLFHIHIRWPIATGRVDDVLSAGAIGMTVFFMLSGFVLTHRYSDSDIDVRGYLTNRFARIYPVYALAAFVTLPWILGLNPSGEDVIVRLAKSAVLMLTEVFAIQAWFPQLFGYWNNGGSWSISAEIFFYLLFPAVLPLLLRRTGRELMAIAAGTYVLSFLPAVILHLFKLSPSLPSQVFYATPIFRLPEFVLGICTCLAVKRQVQLPISSDVALLGSAVALVAYLLAMGPLRPTFTFHNWIVVPLVAVALFTLAQRRGIISGLLSLPAIVWLGKISYCFYSFQLLILLLLSTFHTQLIQAAPVLENNGVLTVASMLILTILSAAGYHFVEEPARKAIRRSNPRPPMPNERSATEQPAISGP